MKTLLLLLALSTMMVSCKKDELQDLEPAKKSKPLPPGGTIGAPIYGGGGPVSYCPSGTYDLQGNCIY